VSSRAQTTGGPRVPFYRNVKTIGTLAQVAFVLVMALGAYVVYRNVTTALQQANIPSDFSFLDDRAGVPIAETAIRYDGDDSYARAFLIGVLNTLKVALLGVALATVLGITIGVMRISRNFLLRAFSTLYVETLRNTPLAVQIIFWYTAVLTPLPPRILNATQLPGGIFLSNQGIALPWPYPSYHFGAWLPWLAVSLLAGAAVWWWRRGVFKRLDRPGNAVGPGLLVALLLAVASYLLAGKGDLPTGTAATFRETSGIITVFTDRDDDGIKDVGERFVPYAALDVNVETVQLQARTQDLVESRQLTFGRFYFPTLETAEFEAVEVDFLDPEAAAEQDLAIHFFDFPSRGVVYRDLNGDGDYDDGEQMNPESERPSGYPATLRLSGEDFQRVLVADRNGEARLPRFSTEVGGGSESRGENLSPAQLFAPAPAAEEPSDVLAVDITPRESRPLVWSVPSIPISTYVGGVRLSTSYLALLLALVVYTASFIAEIVRAGLQAVPIGQREAAKSLGLSDAQSFRHVVFPQAMRIILPPMISQFLNLTKNSSLAPLAAYAELFTISIIIANQTGASVPVTIMIIVAYLVISLVFALVLNTINARMALVER